MSYNTFEALVYIGIYLFTIFAMLYWPNDQSIAFASISFLALVGYSKLYRTWQLEDEVGSLKEKPESQKEKKNPSM